MPGSADDAFLALSDAAYTYDLTAGSTINSLTMSGANSTLSLGSNTLTVNNAVTVNGATNGINIAGGVLNAGSYSSAGTLTLGTGFSSGILSVTGSATNSSGGQWNVAGGGIAQSGSLDNQAGGNITLDSLGYLGVIGTLQNEGTVTLTANYGNSLSAGSIINSNSLTINGTYGFSMYNAVTTPGTFTNNASATVTVGGSGYGIGGQLLVGSPFSNNGTVIVGGATYPLEAGNLTVGSYPGDSGTLVYGNYTQNGGSTTVNGSLNAALVDVEGGTLGGSGIISSDVTIGSGGALSPGDPANTTINGTLTMDGTMVEEIDGPSSDASAFDAITVNGDVNFDGSLEIDLGSYIPVVGDDYLILNWSGNEGDENLTITDPALGNGEYWALDWVNGTDPGGQLFLKVEQGQEPSSVPEPGSLSLLVTGLASLFIARRLRRAK